MHAYRAKGTETVAETSGGSEDDVDNETAYEYDEFPEIPKLNPEEVLDHFKPFDRYFNPAKGVELYNCLDNDGQFIFKCRVVAGVCGAFYILSSYGRFFNLYGQLARVRAERHSERDFFDSVINRLRIERKDAERIIDLYETEFEKGINVDDHFAGVDYLNQKWDFNLYSDIIGSYEEFYGGEKS